MAAFKTLDDLDPVAQGGETEATGIVDVIVQIHGWLTSLGLVVPTVGL